MSEQVFRAIRKIDKAIDYKKVADMRKEAGTVEATREFLKRKKVQITFLREGDPTLQADRQKLNSDRGLIISLHPSGIFDIAPALLALERSDLKIVADNKGGVADSFARLFGPGVMIPIDVTEKTTLRAGLQAVDEHISNGGVVFIFPSSDLDRPAEHNGFRSTLFGNMVRGLDPGDMIYAFKPNLEQSYAARQRYNDPERYVRDKTVMNIDVDERYTTAAEWKSIIDQAGKDKQAIEAGLRRHYDELF